MGSSGNSFPQYLVHLFFAKKHLNLKSKIVIIPIISNDFDESLEKYKSSFGSSFSKDYPNKIKYKNYTNSFRIKLRRQILSTSALSRYLYFNLNIHKKLNKNLICNLVSINCHGKNNVAANIIETTIDENKQRFIDGEYATNRFIQYASKIRPTKQEKLNTIFVVDADRQNIYDPSIPKSSYFEHQRNHFILSARKNGFTVIDMDIKFREHFKIHNKRFEFIDDGHWNSTGHQVVANELAKILDLKKSNKSK